MTRTQLNGLLVGEDIHDWRHVFEGIHLCLLAAERRAALLLTMSCLATGSEAHSQVTRGRKLWNNAVKGIFPLLNYSEPWYLGGHLRTD